MRDRRGSGTLLFGLLFLIPFMVFSFWIIESRLLYIEKSIADDAIVAAGLAALKGANPVEAAYGNYYIDPSQARLVFDEYLKRNMKLDDGFYPEQGSIAMDHVRVEEFIVYNPGDYPTECPNGTLIKDTSIHVVVKFKARRPVLRGLFGEEVDMTIHRDIDNYYVCY